MELNTIITQMTQQAAAVAALTASVSDAQARWRPTPDDWSLLEVLNHLLDEETEDFRTRLDHILHHADQPWPRIDPQGWVTARRYNEQNLAEVRARWLTARTASLAWLATLTHANWQASVTAPWGILQAGDMLAAWTAHDLLHLRQLIELQYAWSQRHAQPYALDYAGDW